MAGRVEEETRLKVAVGTAAIASGPASRKKRAIATPAIATNTGIAEEERGGDDEEEHRRRAVDPGVALPEGNASAAATRAAAGAHDPPRRRRAKSSPARHAKRSAITAKPTGMTSWLHATRIPNATTPNPSHSTRTSCSDAQARRAQVAAETAWPKMRAARRGQPAGTRSSVESARWLPGRRREQRAEEADPQRDVLGEDGGARAARAR